MHYVCMCIGAFLASICSFAHFRPFACCTHSISSICQHKMHECWQFESTIKGKDTHRYVHSHVYFYCSSWVNWWTVWYQFGVPFFGIIFIYIRFTIQRRSSFLFNSASLSQEPTRFQPNATIQFKNRKKNIIYHILFTINNQNECVSDSCRSRHLLSN